MILNTLANEIHNTAKDKGWWETRRDFGMLLALIHSEVSEALEEYREGHPSHVYYRLPQEQGEVDMSEQEYDELQERVKGRIQAEPRGIGIELADVIIRVLDMCSHYGIDIDDAMKRKMAYNKIRPYRHGGKQA